MSYGNNFNHQLIRRYDYDSCNNHRCDNGCNPNCPLNQIQSVQIQQLINNAIAAALIALPPGPPGPAGPPGVATTNGGAIIPFASGPITVTLIAAAIGGIGIGAAVADGSTFPIPNPPGVLNPPGPISLIGLNLPATGEAFVVPRTGIINSIAFAFTPTIATPISLGGQLNLVAQLYSGDVVNTFTPTGAAVTIPILTALGAPFTVSGTAAVNVPVIVGTRLLLIVSANAAGSPAPIGAIATGFVNAGVNIL